MDRETFESLQFDGPMGGEAWRHAPQTMPYDRPSEYHRVEDALDMVFRNLTSPRALSNFLALMESGVALDQFVELTVISMYGEGKINAMMAPLIVPPLTVMLLRVAEAAGIDPTFSDDPNANQVPMAMLMDIKRRGRDNNKMNKAVSANEKSQEELKGMSKNMGLMKRPESIV
jgi:hypothetical protein